jgi:hypothetical protein
VVHPSDSRQGNDTRSTLEKARLEALDAFSELKSIGENGGKGSKTAQVLHLP